MITQPVIPTLTDHGELDGRDDDDHSGYPLLNSNRGLFGNRFYVSHSAYFTEIDGALVLMKNEQEEDRW